MLDKLFFTINASITLLELFYVNLICLIFYTLIIYSVTFNLRFIKSFAKILLKNINRIPTPRKHININFLFFFLFLLHLLTLYLSFKYGIGLHGQEYKVKLPMGLGGLIVYFRNIILPVYLYRHLYFYF